MSEGVWGCAPIQRFFSKPPPSKQMPIPLHPPLKNEAPGSEKQPPAPIPPIET